MQNKIHVQICTSDSDREFVRKFQELVYHLSGLVVEAVEEHPQYLLSPNLRKVLVDNAKLLKCMMERLHGKLNCDNLGDDLPWPTL